jgi:hypothetical protein
VEIEFGLDLSADYGVIIVTYGDKVDFEVILNWTGKWAK